MEKFGKKCKNHIMEEIMADIKARPNIFITNYMGLSTQEMEALRNELCTKGTTSYFVVKNSLTKKVFEKLNLNEATGCLEGGVGLGLAGDDIIAPCKVLAKFSKAHDNLKIKAAVLDGKFLPAARIIEMANLPSKEVLLAMVLGGMKAPITGLVFTLSGILKKFVYCVDAIKKQKESKA